MLRERRGMAKSGKPVPNLQIISLPQPAHHALQGMIHLALAGKACLARDASRARRLPEGALAKVFQRLAHRGLLRARRGPGGGYELARPASRITAAAIVGASTEDGRPWRCLMEDRRCGKGRFCALHHAAVRADSVMRRRLERVTLAELASREPGAWRDKKEGGRR